MNGILIGCILVPMLTAGLAFLGPSDRTVRGGVSIAGSALLLLLGAVLLAVVSERGPLVAEMGSWPAPFGITLIADAFSAMMVLVTGMVGLAVAVYAFSDIDDARAAGGFDSFLQILLAGVVGAFLTGDIFNLYVWFEVMLIASFALMTLGGGKRQLDGAVKYIAINLISTVLLLVAIGLLYGLAGSLNMADLHGRLASVEDTGLLSVVAVLFLIAFGIKAAVFPLFFWLPASYHTPPISVSAVLAGLMTKVGVYALIRTSTLIFPPDMGVVREVIMVTALVTMIVGVFGALAQTDLRRILAFHVIASIGFMLVCLPFGTSLSITAAIFYMVHAMLLKTLLFMMVGAVGRDAGSFELRDLGGLYRRQPGFAVLFLLSALALMGVPPLSGFWAKVMVIRAGLELHAPWVIAVVVVYSFLTFIPMMRIWFEAFWKSRSVATDTEWSPPARPRRFASLTLPATGLALVIISIGLAPAPLLHIAGRAADGILEPDTYVKAVLSPEQGEFPAGTEQ